MVTGAAHDLKRKRRSLLMPKSAIDETRHALKSFFASARLILKAFHDRLCSCPGSAMRRQEAAA
jgi:hypothetical protein